MLASSETTTELENSLAQVRLTQNNFIFTNDILGAFGEVRMCVHRDTGAQRAVKVLKKSSMDVEEEKMMHNEINILRGLVSLLRSKFIYRIIQISLRCTNSSRMRRDITS